MARGVKQTFVTKVALILNVEHRHSYFVSAELQVILIAPSFLSNTTAQTELHTTGRCGAANMFDLNHRDLTAFMMDDKTTYNTLLYSTVVIFK